MADTDESTVKIGSQYPSHSFVLPYTETAGAEAVAAYEQSKRQAMDWQKLVTYDLMARDPTSKL